MKWVIVFWIVGLYPSGSPSNTEYQMVIYEPKFEKRVDCEIYSIQRKSEYLQDFYDNLINFTQFSGFDLLEEPECKIFDEKNMELIDSGPNI